MELTIIDEAVDFFLIAAIANLGEAIDNTIDGKLCSREGILVIVLLLGFSLEDRFSNCSCGEMQVNVMPDHFLTNSIMQGIPQDFLPQ